MAAVAAAASFALLLVGGAGSAAAQDTTTPASPSRCPSPARRKSGKQFAGTYTIQTLRPARWQGLRGRHAQGHAEAPARRALAACGCPPARRPPRRPRSCRSRPRAPAPCSTSCSGRSTSTSSACGSRRTSPAAGRGHPGRGQPARQPAVRGRQPAQPVGEHAAVAARPGAQRAAGARAAPGTPPRPCAGTSLAGAGYRSPGSGRWSSSPASSRPGASTSATTSGRSGSTSRARTAADPSIYCIVDLHAITVEYEPAVLRERVYDTAAILIAAGLDPERCILFRQGDVQEHTELCWLLTSVTRDRRAQPHAPVPRQVRRAAPARLLRAAVLPGAAGRRRARLPRRTRCRSARTSASTSS